MTVRCIALRFKNREFSSRARFSSGIVVDSWSYGHGLVAIILCLVLHVRVFGLHNVVYGKCGERSFKLVLLSNSPLFGLEPFGRALDGMVRWKTFEIR
jgi:hypothetical protein